MPRLSGCGIRYYREKGAVKLMDSEFLAKFSRFKREFLETSPRPSGRFRGSRRKVLENFEHWLQLRTTANLNQKKEESSPCSLTAFLNEVILVSEKLLEGHNIRITCPAPVFKESKRCIRVFENSPVFYRMGRVTPRKGQNKGIQFLVIELVLDGNKKSLFVPLLSMKREMEKILGYELQRELPRVEEAGKYRLKRFLSYGMVESNDVEYVSRALTEFILITVPFLEKLGLCRNS